MLDPFRFLLIAVSRSVRKLDLTDSTEDHGDAVDGGDNVSLAMIHLLDPFRFVVIALSGWMNGRQLLLIDYLREENRVLREQLGGKRLRLLTTKGAGWPPRRKISGGSCWASWVRSLRPRPCWPGIAV